MFGDINYQYRVNLEPVLKKHDLNVYKLAKHFGGNDHKKVTNFTSRLYRLENSSSATISTLSEVVGALREATGNKEIGIQDILIYQPPTDTAMEQPCVN